MYSNMPSVIRFFCSFFLLVICESLVSGQEVGPSYLYFKNNTGSEVYVWVNDQLQGRATAGATSMMPCEGFATSDSGVIGRHSFGGWEKAASLDVKAAGWTEVKNVDGSSGRQLVVWDIPSVGVSKAKSALVWVGEGSPITDMDLEKAGKFQSGTPNSDTYLALKKPLSEPPKDAAIPLGGASSASGKPTFTPPKWTGDGKKAEEIVSFPQWVGIYVSTEKIATGVKPGSGVVKNYYGMEITENGKKISLIFSLDLKTSESFLEGDLTDCKVVDGKTLIREYERNKSEKAIAFKWVLQADGILEMISKDGGPWKRNNFYRKIK
jgi:hypothetical protein